MNLQTKFTELKNKIDSNNILKARQEATLEQKKLELEKVNTELEGVAGTRDFERVNALIEELDNKIEALTKEAEEILTKAGL